MSWPAQQREHTRRRILESASRLFALHGFEAVGIDTVMQDAGLTRGAFYHHFASKSALYVEAIGHAASTGAEMIARMGPDGLGRVVDAYLRREHCEGDEPRCPLAFMAADVVRREPAVRGSYTRTLTGFAGLLQGALGHDAQARERALQVAVSMIGGVMLARAVDDPALAQEILDACRQGCHRVLDDG